MPLNPGDTVSLCETECVVVMHPELGFTLMNTKNHQLHKSFYRPDILTINFIRRDINPEAVCPTHQQKLLKVGDKIAFINCSSATVYTLIYDTYCCEWRVLNNTNHIYYGRWKGHREQGLTLHDIKNWFKDQPTIYVVTE